MELSWPRLWEKRVRCLAWGEEPTKPWYVRITPNPGIGISLGPDQRACISVSRGIEYFERVRDNRWVRVKCWLSPMHVTDLSKRS